MGRRPGRASAMPRGRRGMFAAWLAPSPVLALVQADRWLPCTTWQAICHGPDDDRAAFPHLRDRPHGENRGRRRHGVRAPRLLAGRAAGAPRLAADPAGGTGP